MKGKPKRLGKGLGALIPQQAEATSAAAAPSNGKEQLLEVDIAMVRPNPYQPRLEFDPVALTELKNSIRENGLIQPITVRRVDGAFELIAGERRLRAATEVGYDRIPAYIIKVETKEEMLELALIENVQREKLNPIEQAVAYQRLIDECNLTQDEVAQKIGKERSTITNILRLLRLPDDIQRSLKDGEITVGHARSLVSVEAAADQKALWQKTVKNGLSVRNLEKLVKELATVRPNKPSRTGKDSVFVHSVEEKLRDLFGTKVSIRSRKEGGSIEIEFYSGEDLNRLLDIFDRYQD
jgi:ParB family chromosome partitioning protein